MTWAIMNDIAISAGPAAQECATQIKDQEHGLIEINRFLSIFDAYPRQMWLNVARGQITEIPSLEFSKHVCETQLMGDGHLIYSCGYGKILF